MWGVNAEPRANLYSTPVEVPPARPPCFDRSFAADYVPGAGEDDPPPPPPFELAEDPGAPPMSHYDPNALIAVGRPPHVIPKEVLKAAQVVDGVGYAPNPYYRRGGERGAAYKAAIPLTHKRAESRTAAVDAKKAAAAAAKQSGGGVSASPLPGLYHRVEVRLSASRSKFEEFDFSYYNRTRLPGLVNDLANCYVNPVLQMLHFVPELRARVQGHTCEREFCLTCELAFLSHMLAQSPGGGPGASVYFSTACQPLNFLRTLRQVREAGALGLIEGRDELETRLDQSYARRIQVRRCRLTLSNPS